MHPEYKKIGSPAMRIIEECGEIIQAVMKGERFGWFNYHPDTPAMNNLTHLRLEVDDLINAFNSLEDYHCNIMMREYENENKNS